MKEKISILGIVVNVLLAIGKITTGVFTKSASILADGINSGTDVLASFINLIGIKASKKPADKEHPYGHEKAEVISGLIITIIILSSGIFIVYDALGGFINKEKIIFSYLAFIVMASSAIINLIMSKIKIYYGKKEDSVSLLSDGIHSRIDFLVSAGVFLGLFLSRYWAYFDSIFALVIGIYITKEAFQLGKQTTDILIGKSSPETENKIKKIIEKEGLELLEIKTQKLGSKVFAEIILNLPSKLKVEEASQLTEKMQKKLISQISELNYTSIQIRSHEIQRGFFKPQIGGGFGWQRRKEQGGITPSGGSGPYGYCVCEKCGYKIKHQRGIPCSTIKCPKCKNSMSRK